MPQNTLVGQAHLIPQARRESLIIEELQGETLIYDTVRHQAHCLSPLAAQVLSLCDGSHTVPQVVAALHTDEAQVLRALAQLQDAHLLEPRQVEVQPVESGVAAAPLQRRTLLKKGAQVTAVAAGAFMVTSIVAPTAAQAASLGASGSPCAQNEQCRRGLCVIPTGSSSGTCL